MLKKLLVIASLVLFSATVLANGNGNAEAGKKKSATCVACHGADGNSPAPNFPSLAAQVPGYIAKQLALFKSGERNNAIMAGQVANLSEEDMADLDTFYSIQKAKALSLSASDKELALEGEKIYRGGYAPKDVSACMSCHGPSGHGIPKNYPRVAGQHKDYLEQQLLAFKKGARKGHNDIMWNVAFGLSEEQIKQLAAYMSALN